MIQYLQVLAPFGVVHRFLLAQEFRLLAVMLVLAPVPWLIAFGQDHALFADRHVLRQIRPESGRAAVVRIPEAVEPAVAERGFRVCEGRSVLEMRRLRTHTRIGYFVFNRMDRRFPEFNPLLFRCFHASLGAGLHEDIRREGKGLHEYDGEVLRFSASDETSPARNGRVYLISIPWGTGDAAGARAMLETACRAPIALFAWVLARKRMWPWIRECRRSGALFAVKHPFHDVGAGGAPLMAVRRAAVPVISTGIVLLVAAISMEGYLRWRVPFTENERPVRFDPELGFVFQPNRRFRSTNHTDYWVEQTSNSLGFLDREPAVPKPDGTFRVLVIGDSFVEAAQVDLTEKMHVLLEARLRGALGTDKVDTVAFGHRGSGQSNQLSFYDGYGADVDADLVVLLFYSNDFSDNSTVLQGVINGWDPYRPPKLFYEPDESGAGFTRIGIDADWRNHRLARGGIRRSRDEIMERYPETRALFGGWQPLYRDCMFYTNEEPPPVVQRALASTEHALRLFRERTKNRGEALLLVVTHGVVTTGRHCAGNDSDPRYTFDTLKQLKRITGIAERVGIPVLDLYPAFAERGDWRDTEFAYDRHWNALGHRRAADAIADYLLEHRELLTPTHGERPDGERENPPRRG